MAEEIKLDIKLKKTFWFWLSFVSPTMMRKYFPDKPLVKYTIGPEKKWITYTEAVK